MYRVKSVVAHRLTYDCKRGRLWVRFLHSGKIKYLIFSLPISGNAAKRGVEFRCSIRNTFIIRRKVSQSKRSVLMLGSQIPSAKWNILLYTYLFISLFLFAHDGGHRDIHSRFARFLLILAFTLFCSFGFL